MTLIRKLKHVLHMLEKGGKESMARGKIGGRMWATLLALVLIAGGLTACPPAQTPQQQAESLYNKGNQLWQQNKFDEALNAWERAVEIYPDYYDAHFRLGLAYKQIGDYASDNNNADLAGKAYALAINHYSRCIQIQPEDPSAHNNLGNVYFSLQNYDRAIQEYHTAIKIKPYDPDYHYNLANAYSKVGNAPAAIEHYEEAIRIDPNYFDAYYNLANLYEKMGDVQNAIRYYQEYINRENRPSERQWVERARQKVMQLRGGY